ncbi:TPA: hypothetical protein QEL15_000131 [Stenotrophomonas maltophilia]|nr:hypothetical protein [Stenotrophomonas maltophilia]
MRIVLSSTGEGVMHYTGTGGTGCHIGLSAALCAAGVIQTLNAATATAAESPQVMAAQEAQDVMHVLGTLEPWRPYVLNLADPQQLGFTQRALAAGRTPANAPATFAALQSSAQRARTLATPNYCVRRQAYRAGQLRLAGR